MIQKRPSKRHNINFWKNIRFKYRLSITNENTLEEVLGLYVSKLNGLSVLITFIVVVLLIASLIIAFTPLRNYLPGYMNAEIRAQIVSNALKADSLESLTHKQNAYILNLQHIFKEDIPHDSIEQIIKTPLKINIDSAMKASENELEFRKKYEEKEKYALTENKKSVTTPTLHDIIQLQQPLQGVITESYNVDKGDYGIQIVAPKVNPIIATISGNIIFSGMTIENGYVIEIQNRDIVAVYKNCGKLLKSIGEQVKAGDVIASTAPHQPIIFEVWKSGTAINPIKHFVL